MEPMTENHTEQERARLVCKYYVVMLWSWIIHEAVSNITYHKMRYYSNIFMDLVGVTFVGK